MGWPCRDGWVAKRQDAFPSIARYDRRNTQPSSPMTKRQVYDSERHIHFVTFSCYKRRNHLQQGIACRIVVGEPGSWLSHFSGGCIGFVIMPNDLHVLLWFSEDHQLSKFLNQWKERTSKSIKAVLEQRFPNYWSHIDPMEPIWQSRFYDFNIWSRSKAEEKL